MTTSTDLAQLIRELTDAGWSQKRIAEAIGVGQGTVFRIKSGDVDPAYSTATKLIALHTSVCNSANAA